MAGFDESMIIALASQPISDSARTGKDIADDEEFLLLEAEIVKLDRIDLGEPDWRNIEQACLNILRTKSKDLQVACCLGFALIKKHRFAGLAASLELFLGLVKNFWDGLFPERPRRRKSRLEAFVERLVEGGWLRGAAPSGDEFDALDRCLSLTGQLQETLTANMPDDPPDFGKFRRKIKDLAETRPKVDEPAAAPAAPEPGGTAAAPTTASFSGGEMQDVSGAVSAIWNAVAFARKADLADPLPYATARAVRWARLQLPTGEAAQQPVEPPEKSLVEALTHQFANGMWDALLKNAEGAFRGNDPLWLDLQRFVCVAMQNLGPKYERARALVMGMTGNLVRRLGNGVYSLTFRGGTPLCSGETKMWLEAEVLAVEGGGHGGSAVAGADGKLTEATDAARKLAAGGKLAEAIGALQAGLATCVQRRDRLLWRLRIAELCSDANRLQLAAPLLEECHEEIRRYHIDDWEPVLAVEVARALYRCRKAQIVVEKQPSVEALASVRDSYAWLCQLDPLAALAAEPAGK